MARINDDTVLNFMAGSAMIFSGFAIKALDLEKQMSTLTEIFDTLPEWVPANLLVASTGLTVDAIRAQIQNIKIFEPEAEVQQRGRIWYIHKSAIPKVRRQK